MSTEPPDDIVPPIAEDRASSPLGADAEAPRTVRMVPRPGTSGPPSRKGTHPGFAAVPGEMPVPVLGSPVNVPPPTPSDIPPPAQMPQLPEARAVIAAEDAAATERRPELSADVGSPPEIQRFLSPLPPPPSAEPPSAPGSEPAARRRSRRTVKIPDDAIPQKAAPAPAPVAAPPAPVAPPPAPVAAPPPVAALPSVVVTQPVAALPSVVVTQPVSATPLQVIPPSPPIPMLTAPRPPGSIPRPGPRSTAAMVAVTAPASDEAPKTVADPGVAAAEAYEVIRPMRIINIGTVPPPPAEPVAEAAPAAEEPWDPTARRPSRPPMPASTELDAFVAAAPPPPPPAPPPKPPAVEEVEAIAEDAEDEAQAPVTAAPTAVRASALASIADADADEVDADRISDVSPDEVAVPEEIPIDVVVDAPPPTKKPPPPPPKRAAPGEASPPLAMTQPSPPTSAASPPPPPPARAVEALAALPASAVTPVTPPPVTPPPPPAAPAAPAVAPPRETAQTLDLSGRKRVKPWWEEIFSDDYLRTMEKVEPKAIRKECDFIEDRLGLEKGAIMLDLACGPGAHAVELASRGYNVVGYDLSLAMLARAQDEAQERGQKINFLQGDMREMAFEEAFDGIYSWSTSFGYFDDEKNVNVLSRMHRALRQGGMLLLDVANRDYICPRQPSLVWFEGEGCVCMDEMHVDFFSSRLKVKRTVMFDDGRARECDYAIRIYGLHELGKMLHDTGFKVVEVTGHPSHPGVFFGSESPRIIVLAERA
jgi:SAM-dependent methyltransferase